ncbi:MAG: trigger factor [Candidatus Peregrinibacteria bacterium]|nr:trigger factor [Candidatus Peregrinibacteria bacterium]MDZ4245319.1 trigger factor [Candidatus Gracilibacteria bacterium]
MANEVTIKKIKDSQAEINVKVSVAEFKKYKEKSLKELGRNVKIKGFRAGHVPHDVLEKHVSKEGILGLAIDMALTASYREAIIEHKVEVMSRPNVKIESEDPLEYTVTVAIKPDAKVKDYKKIKVDIKEQKVSKKEIEETVQDLLKGKGEWHDTDRNAKSGDRVEVDFQGYDGTKVAEGKEVPNTKSTNHPLILGSNSFVPGFEDAIQGMKVGDTKEFTVTFPKDYHVDDFKNKKVTFKANLKRLEEQKLPEYNDEFIKEATNGLKTNKKDFEIYVEEVLSDKKKDDAKGKAEGELIEKILKATEVEIAPQLIEQETEVIFNDYKRQIESKGITFEKHLEMSKADPEAMKKEMAKEAGKRVKMRFALDYIIEQEKFDVTEKEVEKEIEMITSRYPAGEHSKIAEHYKKDSDNFIRLKNMLVVGKVFEMYFAK